MRGFLAGAQYSRDFQKLALAARAALD